MKNMKKVLAVMTAVSAMTASTSAFAATTVGETDASSIITFTQAVKNDEGAVTTGNSIAVDAMPAGIVDGEVTLLVLDYATVETAVADDDILYIDQGTYENSTNPFAGKALGLKVSDIVAAAEAQFATDSAADTTLETKTYSYPVKLGYYDADEFAIATASIDVTVAKDAPSGKTVTVTWGDVNLNGVANTGDATDIMNAFAGGTSTFTDGTYTFTWGSDVVVENATTKQYKSNVVWGDINQNTAANTGDATDIMNAFAGGTSTFGDYKWNGSTPAEITLTEIK